MRRIAHRTGSDRSALPWSPPCARRRIRAAPAAPARHGPARRPRDGAVHQFELLLVELQFDHRFGHSRASPAATRRAILYTVLIATPGAAISVWPATRCDYRRIVLPNRAQTLSEVLPNIRARRLLFPHLVYSSCCYRTPDLRRSTRTGTRLRNADEQEVHPRRSGLSGVATGHHRAGAAAGHQAAGGRTRARASA